MIFYPWILPNISQNELFKEDVELQIVISYIFI